MPSARVYGSYRGRVTVHVSIELTGVYAEGMGLSSRRALPHIDAETASLDELAEARARSWVAVSDRGYEVLRYDEGMALLRDRRFLKGATFRRRLDNLGLVDGPIREAYDRMLVSNDGEQRTHLRGPLTRLLGPRRTLLHAQTTRE